tara:strand:- start:6345 stop:6683 length:339 start_codon:yes stop_codon:yes gene_type:complete
METKFTDANEIEAAFIICASICGQDGIISSEEEEALTQRFESLYDLNGAEINSLFDKFFNSKQHIDQYLAQITNIKVQKQVIEIAEFSASVDDLDIRENIALQRTKVVWGIS